MTQKLSKFSAFSTLVIGWILWSATFLMAFLSPVLVLIFWSMGSDIYKYFLVPALVMGLLFLTFVPARFGVQSSR